MVERVSCRIVELTNWKQQLLSPKIESICSGHSFSILKELAAKIHLLFIMTVGRHHCYGDRFTVY